MTRILLFLLVFVLLAADTLGINLSLAPGISVKNGLLYAIAFFLIIETSLSRNRRVEMMPVIAPQVLYIVYASFMVAFVWLIVDYPWYGLGRSIISLKAGPIDNLLVFLVFFYGVLTTRDAVWLLKAMIWTVLAGNVVTVIDGLNIPDLGLLTEREQDGRFQGPIGESNQFAAFVILFLPAAIALVVVERGLLRVLAAVGAAFSFVALIFSGSRGGLVGLIGGAIVGAVFMKRFISRRTLILSAASMVVFASVALVIASMTGYGELLYTRFVWLSTSGDAFDISSGRTAIWSKPLSMLLENPISLLTGFGWDTYTQSKFFRFAAHNTYLKIFFELGFIGLVSILCALGAILIRARRGLQLAGSAEGPFLTAFIFGFLAILLAIVFVDIASPWIFIWAYAGIAMRIAVLQEPLAASAESPQRRQAVISNASPSAVGGQ